MIHELTVPFSDARADQLRLSLDTGLLPAESTRTIALDGASIELRILRASHQVVYTNGTTQLIETLACHGDGGSLATGTTETIRGGLRHRIDINVGEYDAAAFARTVNDLLNDVTDDPRAIVGRFPRHEHAITALRLDHTDERGASPQWSTWHCYPQVGQIVHTQTSIAVPAMTLGDLP